jgi:hypothetical protein
MDEIRASLSPEDIVEMTQTPFRPEVVGFPDDLPLPEEQRSAFRALHELLASVGTAEGISYAQQLAPGTRRRHLLKILWAFGRFGQRKEEGGPHLVIDSETYLAQKIHSDYSRVKDYLGILGEYGVRCEPVPLAEEGWLAPTKALRKRGWYMKLSFDQDAGRAAALEALRSYGARLDEVCGKEAFRRFARADMQVLSGVG